MAWPSILTEMIGWTAAAILLLTIGRQVYVQWRGKTSSGVSKWLFIGQISASIAFVIYISLLLGSWAFAARATSARRKHRPRRPCRPSPGC
jgi:uncharacterized protein with PQ loop repeat